MIKQGWAEYNSRRIPMDAVAGGLQARLNYDARPAGYAGELQAAAIQLHPPGAEPPPFRLDSQFTLRKTGIQIFHAQVDMAHSRLEASGAINSLDAPAAALQISAVLRPEDFPFLALPIVHTGEVRFTGEASLQSSPAFDWRVHGQADGQRLGLP